MNDTIEIGIIGASDCPYLYFVEVDYMAYGKVIQGERDKLVKRIWRTESRSGKKFLTKGTRNYSTQELRDIDKESREKYPTKQEKAKQEKAKQGKLKKSILADILQEKHLKLVGGTKK